jgi:hypothetical protein
MFMNHVLVSEVWDWTLLDLVLISLLQADRTTDATYDEPIAVAARSKARTVFARSNTEIVGSNQT